MRKPQCNRCYARHNWFKIESGAGVCPDCGNTAEENIAALTAEPPPPPEPSSPPAQKTRRGGTFHKTPSAATLDRDLGDRAYRVLGVLLHHADNSSREAWPSRSRIAAILGKSVRCVSDGLRELRDRGYINAVGSMGKGIVRYRVSLGRQDSS